jgi:hypothetical protein
LPEFKDEGIIIRGVPAFVCEQCGEGYHRVDISKKIDEVMKDAHNGKICVRPIAAGEIELRVLEAEKDS